MAEDTDIVNSGILMEIVCDLLNGTNINDHFSCLETLLTPTSKISNPKKKDTKLMAVSLSILNQLFSKFCQFTLSIKFAVKW